MKRVGRRGRVLGTVRLEGDMLNDITQKHLLQAAGISTDMLEEMSGEERKQTLTAILESSPLLLNKCVQEMLLPDGAERPTSTEGSNLETLTREKLRAATDDMAWGQATQSSKRPTRGRDQEEALKYKTETSEEETQRYETDTSEDETQRYETETCEDETQRHETETCEDETQRYETQTCEDETQRYETETFDFRINTDIMQQKVPQDTATRNQTGDRSPDKDGEQGISMSWVYRKHLMQHKIMFSPSFYMPQQMSKPDSYTHIIKLMLDMYRRRVSRTHKHTIGIMKAWGKPVTAGPHVYGCLVARHKAVFEDELGQEQEREGRRALRRRFHKEKQGQTHFDSRQRRPGKDLGVRLSGQHLDADSDYLHNKLKVHHGTGSTSMVSSYRQSTQGGLDESFGLNEENAALTRECETDAALTRECETDAALTRECETDDGKDEWLLSRTRSRTIARKSNKANTNGKVQQLQVSQSTDYQKGCQKSWGKDSQATSRECILDNKCITGVKKLKQEVIDKQVWIKQEYEQCDTLIQDKSVSSEIGSGSFHLQDIHWIDGLGGHLGAHDGVILAGRLATSHSQDRHFTACKHVASDGEADMLSAFVQVSNEESSNERTLVPANVSSNERTLVPANVSSNERTLVPANVSSNERTLVPANVSSNERTLVPANVSSNERTLVPANVSSNQRTLVPANVSSNERTLVPANVYSNERTLVPANVSSNERTLVPAKIFQHEESIDGYNHSQTRLAAPVITDINSSSQSSESLLDSNGNLYGTQICSLVSGLLETDPSANLLQQHTRTAQMSTESTAKGLCKSINDQSIVENKPVRQMVGFVETQIRTAKSHSEAGSTQLLTTQYKVSDDGASMEQTDKDFLRKDKNQGLISATILQPQKTQTNSQNRKRKLLAMTRTEPDKSNRQQTLQQKKQKVSKRFEEHPDKSTSVGGDTDQPVGTDDSTGDNLGHYHSPIGKSRAGSQQGVIMSDVSQQGVIMSDVSQQVVIMSDVSQQGVIMSDVSQQGVIMSDVSQQGVIMSDNMCPLCGKSFPPSLLETHASSCGEDLAVGSHQDKHTTCVSCKLQIPSELIWDHHAICVVHRHVPEKRITRSAKE